MKGPFPVLCACLMASACANPLPKPASRSQCDFVPVVTVIELGEPGVAYTEPASQVAHLSLARRHVLFAPPAESNTGPDTSSGSEIINEVPPPETARTSSERAGPATPATPVGIAKPSPAEPTVKSAGANAAMQVWNRYCTGAPMTKEDWAIVDGSDIPAHWREECLPSK